MLKEFHGAATLQKIVTKLSKSKFNTGKHWVVRCILGQSRGRVLKNFPGGAPPDSCKLFDLPLRYIFVFFYQLLLNTEVVKSDQVFQQNTSNESISPDSEN